MGEKSDRQHLRWILKSKSHTTSIRVLSEWHLIHRRSQFHDWRNRLRQTQSGPSGEIWLGWNHVDSMDLALRVSSGGQFWPNFRYGNESKQIANPISDSEMRFWNPKQIWKLSRFESNQAMTCCLNSVMRLRCNFLNELQMGIHVNLRTESNWCQIRWSFPLSL